MIDDKIVKNCAGKHEKVPNRVHIFYFFTLMVKHRANCVEYTAHDQINNGSPIQMLNQGFKEENDQPAKTNIANHRKCFKAL